MRVLIVLVLLLTYQIRCLFFYKDKTLEGALRNAGWVCRDPETREEFYDRGPRTCGPSCARLGTCCQDSEYFVQEEQSWGEHIPSCIVMTESHILVHTSCPSYWEQNDTRTRCEQPDITYPDPLLDVPVTSRRTNITYYNGHCAICHGDFDPSVDVLWPFEFKCGPSDLYIILQLPRHVSVLEPCYNSSTNMTDNNQENMNSSSAQNNVGKDYTYGGYDFQAYQNIPSVTPANSLTECLSYNVSGSKWHMDLTCAYFYYRKQRLQTQQNETDTYEGNQHDVNITNDYDDYDDDNNDNAYDYGNNDNLTSQHNKYSVHDDDNNYDNVSEYNNTFSNDDDDDDDDDDDEDDDDDDDKDIFTYSYGESDTLVPNFNTTFSNCGYKLFPRRRKYLLIPVGTVQCTVKILYPELNGTSLHYCPQNYVETCAKDWEDKEVEDRCKEYKSEWCDESYVYRNAYCAYCNYVDEFKNWGCVAVDPVSLSFDFSILLKWYDLNSQCSDTEIFDEVKSVCRNKENFNEGEKFNISRLRNETSLDTDNPVAPVLAYVTIVGLSLSITCLVLHLLVFILTPKQRNLPIMNLASLCVSLLFLYCSFMVSGYLEPPCVALAVILHYTLLVTFFWMAVISFDVWKTIRLSIKEARASPGRQWKKFCVYSTFCWIVPLIVIASALIVDFYVHDSNFRPEYGVTNCWIGNRDALLVLVVTPLCIVMTLNAVFFSWSSCLIYFAKKKISKSSNARTDFRLFLRLAIIMGLTWITGVVAAVLKIEGIRSARFNSTDIQEEEAGYAPNGYVTFIGLSVSMTCLILHLIVFLLTPKLRNLASMNVASLCVALLLLYSSFIASSFSEPPCAEPAIILHYSLLATFTWMLVISFDVWKTIRRSVNEIRILSGPQWKRFSVYSAFCWIVPVIILTPALIVEFFAPDSDFRSYYGVASCWIQNRDALLVFVVTPLSIVMILNVVFFSWSSYLVYTTKSEIAKTSNERKDFSLFLRMAIIMGLTWTTGLVAGLVQYAGVWYVFIVLNTLQGLFIFIAFSWREKILKEVLGQRRCFLCADT